MNLAKVPHEIGDVPARAATDDCIEVPIRRICQGQTMVPNRLDRSLGRKHSKERNCSPAFEPRQERITEGGRGIRASSVGAGSLLSPCLRGDRPSGARSRRVSELRSQANPNGRRRHVSKCPKQKNQRRNAIGNDRGRTVAVITSLLRKSAKESGWSMGRGGTLCRGNEPFRCPSS